MSSAKTGARLRRLVRGLVPPRIRPALRRFVTDVPHRLRDFFPDAADTVASLNSLPPAQLRARVGLNSSRREFLRVGESVADDLLGSLGTIGVALAEFPVWLDFGCGCGRIARHVVETSTVKKLFGVDIDRVAVDWSRRHLLGTYQVIQPNPPMGFKDGAFDLVYSVSVFTHLDEAAQRSWLSEILRVLRPGGLFVASTHAPELTWSRPDLTPQQHRALVETGFLFAPGVYAFNEASAFHSEQYLRSEWGRFFQLQAFQSHGLAGYQDLAVWLKPPQPASSE